MPECLELGAAVDSSAFVQFLRDVLEEGVQHPESERLIDGNEHDDCRRQNAPDVPFKERQHVTRYKCDRGHGTENQCNDQEPECVAIAGARQRVATKGSLPAGLTFRKHVLRNASGPMLSVVGLQVPAMLAGTVVIERAFDLDGLGSLLLTGVNSSDFPIVQAVALIMVTATVVINVGVDIVLAFLDPRIRLDRRQ